jgi:hypothetical protein
MDSSKIETTKQVEVQVVKPEHSGAAWPPLDKHAWDKAEGDHEEECMRQTAWLLVHTAIETHRRKHGLDRTRALYWIRSAVEMTE